jgi:hypothetical protein
LTGREINLPKVFVLRQFIAAFTFRRHPALLALLASLEGWQQARVWPILRDAAQMRGSQDDDLLFSVIPGRASAARTRNPEISAPNFWIPGLRPRGRFPE